MTTRPQGFAMLLSVFILAAIGTAIATALLALSISAAQTTGTIGESLQAKHLANTCEEAALQHLVVTRTYTGSGSLTLGQGTCSYTVAVRDSTSDLVTASGVVGATTRKVEVVILVPQLFISTWQEVSDF